MLNNMQVIGHLGGDVDVRYTQGGKAVANFSVATTERWKNKDGEQQEKTEWHRIVAFDKLGELCGEYLSKGKLAYIQGSLYTEKWTDDNGIERYATKVRAKEVKFLSPREGGRDSGHDEPRQPARGGTRRSAPQQQAPQQDDFSDDEIPF